MTRYILLTTLIAILALPACKDDQTYSDDDGCAGELIDVDGDSYCVFIEEGFLEEDCPEGFPHGHEIGGVIVCSGEEDVDDDKVLEELGRRGLEKAPACESDADCERGRMCEDGFCGWAISPECDSDSDCREGELCVDGQCGRPIPPECQSDADCDVEEYCINGGCFPRDGECTTRDDCPASNPTSVCNGTVAIFDADLWDCSQGVCGMDGSPVERDCALEGLACVDGDCVGADECTVQEDCDNREGFLYCEGTSVWEDFGSYSDCNEGTCITAPGLPPMELENCADDGEVCFEGACVAGGGECTEDFECAVDGAYITCEGPNAVLVAVSGECAEGGFCVETENRTVTECEAQGQYCSDGNCVTPGGACQTSDDCPQPNQDPYCDGNVAVTPPGDMAECNGGVCTIIGEPVLPMRQDCDELGTMCLNGSCGE
jgi:hypothetical protein